MVLQTENLTQFVVYTNIPGSFQGPIDLISSVKDSKNRVIKDSDWDQGMIPKTTWNAVPGACRAFGSAMQNVWPAWNSVIGISPGTTHTFEAELKLKPMGEPEVAHRASHQVTTGCGCSVGAPDDCLLCKSIWNGIGIDADNKAVLTRLSVNIDAIATWAGDIYPRIVQWVPEYLWTGRTMTREGYFRDSSPRTLDRHYRLVKLMISPTCWSSCNWVLVTLRGSTLRLSLSHSLNLFAK